MLTLHQVPCRPAGQQRDYRSPEVEKGAETGGLGREGAETLHVEALGKKQIRPLHWPHPQDWQAPPIRL